MKPITALPACPLGVDSLVIVKKFWKCFSKNNCQCAKYQSHNYWMKREKDATSNSRTSKHFIEMIFEFCAFCHNINLFFSLQRMIRTSKLLKSLTALIEFWLSGNSYGKTNGQNAGIKKPCISIKCYDILAFTDLPSGILILVMWEKRTSEFSPNYKKYIEMLWKKPTFQRSGIWLCNPISMKHLI
jgi:hypothetical protein